LQNGKTTVPHLCRADNTVGRGKSARLRDETLQDLSHAIYVGKTQCAIDVLVFGNAEPAAPDPGIA
jgi:hypothetical protein